MAFFALLCRGVSETHAMQATNLAQEGAGRAGQLPNGSTNKLQLGRATIRMHGVGGMQKQRVQRLDGEGMAGSLEGGRVEQDLRRVEPLETVVQDMKQASMAEAQARRDAALVEALDIQSRLEEDLDTISEAEEDFDNPMSLADLANSLAS